MEKKSRLLTAEEAAEYLRVGKATLAKIDEEVQPARTPGGHRRYKLEWLNRYLYGSRREEEPGQ